jgi:peptide-methionine (S)-S-oxide reductase
MMLAPNIVQLFLCTIKSSLIRQYYLSALEKEHVFNKPIVTEVVPVTVFYPAEDYHQDYYRLNGKEPYCQLVIKPKLEKFKRIFSKVLKEGQ